MYDEFISNINDGKIPDGFEFSLLEKDINNNIIEVQYSGVWFMVDNGYLNWSCTVPPDSNGKTFDEIRFSEWLESMRKDVECVFGVMKGRFRILRYRFRLRKIYLCDQLWLTCCALHNMLLNVDGLDSNWENGGKSDWEMFQMTYERNHSGQQFAIERLHRHSDSQSTHKSNVLDDSEHISRSCQKYTVNGKRIVHDMPLSLFRKCLINHFNIRFKQNTVVWPKRIQVPKFY